MTQVVQGWMCVEKHSLGYIMLRVSQRRETPLLWSICLCPRIANRADDLDSLLIQTALLALINVSPKSLCIISLMVKPVQVNRRRESL